ncbi:MAG: hypothetical protein CM15mP83_6100 [Flavobacteriaceae bacterium]|nr:MAG: hypothetical protein CM15mP83_6100 [Flavobacteriaceae bacterium]
MGSPNKFNATRLLKNGMPIGWQTIIFILHLILVNPNHCHSSTQVTGVLHMGT